jgi:hypothetical protein
MSRKGDCWDNAVVESFFATLKTELIHQEDFLTRRQATGQIFWFIEGFYNTSRKHSFLGQISPLQYEERSSTTQFRVNETGGTPVGETLDGLTRGAHDEYAASFSL